MNDAHPQRWREAFQAHGREAQALAAGLSYETFNRPPEEGAWSVGQCLDHLCQAGRPLASRLSEALAQAPSRNASRAPWRGVLDRLFAWAMRQGAWLKIPSPAPYRPSAGRLDPERTLRAFQGLQDALAACARAAEGRDWAAVRVASPANRFVRLTAGGWLEGTLAHQQRHLRQASRARAKVEDAR